ncbi:replication protein P [Klebsiella pneumoniae]
MDSAAFAEGGYPYPRAGISRNAPCSEACESPFWPSPGQFIKWRSKTSCRYLVLGRGAITKMGCRGVSPPRQGEKPTAWRTRTIPVAPPCHVLALCAIPVRAMYQRQLSEIEVEKHARKLLDEWASKVAAGHQMPRSGLS